MSISGATIYITTHPCIVCSKMIMNSQIKEIVYAQGYPDELAELMLLESNIKKRKFELPEEETRAMLGEFYAKMPGND